MKRNIVKYMSLALLFASASAFTACNDTESVDLIAPSIDGQNPELYAQYLQNLRAYKATDHVLVYAWMDNSNKEPNSRAEHIADLPDSIDVVSLTFPQVMCDWELQEMNEVRDKKATKFIYDVDFDAIKADYNALLEVATDEEPVSTDFIGYLMETLESRLSYYDKFGFDGICISYQGKSTLHMQRDELKEYKANEAAFFNILDDWFSRHAGALLVFSGKPENVANPSMLMDCTSVLVDGTSAKSADGLSQAFAMSQTEDAEMLPLGIVVNCFDLADENQVIGYFSDGSYAIDGVAAWAAQEHSGVNVYAVGVKGVGSDYYNPQKVYSHLRALIATVNPPVK